MEGSNNWGVPFLGSVNEGSYYFGSVQTGASAVHEVREIYKYAVRTF